MQIMFVVLFIILFFVQSAFALDTSTDSGKTKKHDREQSQSLKRSKEEKETEGKKRAKTTTTGRDLTDSETIKAIGQAMNQSGADIALPIETAFLDRIAQLEDNVEPFKSCRIATMPKLSRDFGLTAEIRPGVIDTIKADYLSKAAQSNSYIRDVVDEKAVKAHRDCLAIYGAIIAQAYLNLTQDLNDLKVSVSKDKDGNVEVKDIGYDDFVLLVNAALDKAIKDGITNQTVYRTYKRITTDHSPCQFDKSIESIKCGSSLIILSTKSQLFVSGIQWYGERFAGYQGSYKVSKAWSYQDAIEKLKTTSQYSKWASEVSKYAEELESNGKVKEAALVRKKAWELAKSGKQAVSPAKLIPGI